MTVTEPDLLITDHGRVRLLTLNRAGALNAFNDALYRAVTTALTKAAESPDVAVVILTGTGRAFSAGQDLLELADDRSHEQRQDDGFGGFIETLESFPKPLIAAVNGLGIGIGMTMLPHCDIVLIADTARLRVPFASLGVTAEAGSSYLLPTRIGWAAAAHALFTARWLSADDALACGLAYRKLPAEQLQGAALELAQEIAAMPIASLVATKRLMLDARVPASKAARQRENISFGQLIGGPANREAMAAFAEKRPADFSRC